MKAQRLMFRSHFAVRHSGAMCIVGGVFALLCHSASAADEWPPLNAVEEQDWLTSGVRFRGLGPYYWTRGYFRWRVERYSADDVRYNKSLNYGPRSWSWTLGPNGVVKSDNWSDNNDSKNEGSRPKTSPSLLAPGSLNALPALPPVASQLPSLPPLARFNDLGALPQLPAPRDLPPLR